MNIKTYLFCAFLLSFSVLLIGQNLKEINFDFNKIKISNIKYENRIYSRVRYENAIS